MVSNLLLLKVQNWQIQERFALDLFSETVLPVAESLPIRSAKRSEKHN